MSEAKQPKMATIVVPEARVDDLKIIIDRGTQIRSTLNEIEANLKESRKELSANEALRRKQEQAARDLELVAEKRKPKNWDWKRGTWAAVSGVLGGALAYVLHKRVPAMNQAACGVSGVLLADYAGFDKRHSALMGAGTGILGIWSHENMPILEVAMAGVAYGDFIFEQGELIKEGVDMFRAAQLEKKAQVSKDEA